MSFVIAAGGSGSPPLTVASPGHAMNGLDLIASSVCNGSVCEFVNDIPLLDLQITKKQSDLLNLTNEINGKHLKVATFSNYPLSYVEAGPNGTLVGLGVAFALLKILQKRFNFTYDVVVPAKNFLGGGTRPEESLVGLINSSQADMAAAFIPKIARFQKSLLFSSDLDEGVWMMMLKRPKASAAGSGLMAPFNNLVWYLTLTAVLAYGPCITFLTRIRSRIIHDKERHLSLSPSFWFVYSSFIKQGTNLEPNAKLSHNHSRSIQSMIVSALMDYVIYHSVTPQLTLHNQNVIDATRILFATWWMFIILLSAFYTANLTAFLTLSKFTLDIEDPEDLLKKNYRWMSTEGGSVQYVVKNPLDDLYYLNKMITKGRAEFKNYGSDSGYLPFVEGGGVLVKESVSIDHLMYNDYLNKANEGVLEVDRCTYVIAPKPFMKKARGFAYPVGSSLQQLFDSVLIYMLQAGIIDFLEHRDLPSTKICPLDLQSKDRQLRNSDLLMTYLIICVGLAAATAVFIGEVLFKRYIYKSAENPPIPKKSKFQRRRKKQDESQPPPYDSLFSNPKYNINERTQSKIINGREYYVYNASNGDERLIPVRTPSALLYH